MPKVLAKSIADAGGDNEFFHSQLMRPYFDSDFTVTEFLRGAKEAIQFVSSRIAAGDIDGLVNTELVDKDALREIERNLYSLSAQQRKLLAVGCRRSRETLFLFSFAKSSQSSKSLVL